MDDKNNSGNWNSGGWNSGNWNSGNWNSGDWNSGDWNSTNHSNGFFNSEEMTRIDVFNKPCLKSTFDECEKPSFLYFKLAEWILVSDMTSAEKDSFKSHETCGGFLRIKGYKEAFKESYDKASDNDKALLLKLPNFDAEVFKEISGIDVNEDSEKSKLQRDFDELMAKAEEIKNQIDSM